MSSVNHGSTKSVPKLELYRFPVLSPDEIVFFTSTFKKVLFGAPSMNDRCEINPISGYISYSKSLEDRASAGEGGSNLPQTEAEATQAALSILEKKYQAFLSTTSLQNPIQQRYNKGKTLQFGFAPIPNPAWLKLIEVYPVKTKDEAHADHWLCKFEVALPMRTGKAHLLNASIDVRVGATVFGGNNELVGLVSRFRPVIYAPSQPLGKFLPDTGQPAHGEGHEGSDHGIHIGGESLIGYIQSDENTPQFNLLPYEITGDGGHHLDILPASKESLWLELSAETTRSEIKLYALVMGGSGDYDAKWGYWSTTGIMSEAEELVNSVNSKTANLQHSNAFDGVAIAEFKVPKGIWDVGISVYDRQNHNVIHKVVSLTVNPYGNSFSAPNLQFS